MSIVTRTQALKKLYKAVVGEDTTKNDPTKIISELADNWEGGGGGGSSDFSTAEVTITLQKIDPNRPFFWPTPTIISDKLICSNYAQQTATETHAVVLYKGSCKVFMENVSSTSGNIVVEDDVATITGDCTITIS